MSFQTIEQVLPLLMLLQQPAFCVDETGAVHSNRAAAVLAPASGQLLPHWLGSSADAYAAWDRRSDLVLSVAIGRHTIQATAHPLSNGALFLLSGCEALQAGASDLSVAAQVIRQPLNEVYQLTQQLSESLEEMEDPVLQNQNAALLHHIYRLNRIACNLADLTLLQNGGYPVRPEKLDLTAFLYTFAEEMEGSLRYSGYELDFRLPERQIMVFCDHILLERALLNLFSNAMRFGKKETPIEFQVTTTDSSVLFRVRNTCSAADSDLLTAAFQRLKQRGMIPDPNWGVGLGLPLTLCIAQQMGGTIAVAVSPEHVATVTMSISRKRELKDPEFHTLPAYDYTGGMNRSLVELADSLPDQFYDAAAI